MAHLQIPSSKCYQLRIDEDIATTCIGITDINCDDTENMIVGSWNGVIRVVNVSASAGCES